MTAIMRAGRRLYNFLRHGVSDLRGTFATRSYSQEGEDLILRRYLDMGRKGFYVDVGAHHPMRFSNTYAFYKAGWSGINIDAMPGSMELFRQWRPRDFNVEAAISSTPKILTYFSFAEPALNTFDAALADQRIKASCRLLEKIELVTRPLHAVLGDHLPYNLRIDFMSVDVEGFDLDVLQSNDWGRFRPAFVLVESSGTAAGLVSEVQNTGLHSYMAGQGYALVAKAFLTLLYKDVRTG